LRNTILIIPRKQYVRFLTLFGHFFMSIHRHNVPKKESGMSVFFYENGRT